MDTILLLRLYLEVKTKEDADRIIDLLISKLKFQCSETSRKIEKYWKIQEYFEVFLKLKPIGDSNDNFYDIIGIIGKDWEIHDKQEGDPWAVWTYDLNKQIINPAIKWANIESI